MGEAGDEMVPEPESFVDPLDPTTQHQEWEQKFEAEGGVDSTQPRLVCTLTNESSRPSEKIKELKLKTRRRALRYFDGKEVKHRVTEKNANVIEFAYFRRSGKPVKIRWQKASIQSQT